MIQIDVIIIKKLYIKLNPILTTDGYDTVIISFHEAEQIPNYVFKA